MKNIRNIDEIERDILLKGRIKSRISLGILFYTMGILLPFITCMIITRDFTYLYLFLIGIILLLFVSCVYPMICFNHFQMGKIKCFDSVILSCYSSKIYYYNVEIENIKGELSMEKYPISKRVKKGESIVVVMPYGKHHPHKFLLVDKDNRILLSSKRTRYDLID